MREARHRGVGFYGSIYRKLTSCGKDCAVDARALAGSEPEEITNQACEGTCWELETFYALTQ